LFVKKKIKTFNFFFLSILKLNYFRNLKIKEKNFKFCFSKYQQNILGNSFLKMNVLKIEKCKKN